jgi:hypothetical protein
LTDKQKDILKVALAWTVIIGLEVGWIIYLFVFGGPLPWLDKP